MKTVTVRIDNNGDIFTNFDGMVGDECLQEAEKLKKILKELGIELDMKEFQSKNPDEEYPKNRNSVKE